MNFQILLEDGTEMTDENDFGRKSPSVATQENELPNKCGTANNAEGIFHFFSLYTI